MMKSTTFRETRTLQRILLVMLIAAMFSVLFIMMAKPTYADGSHAINGKFVTNTDSGVANLPEDLTTTFSLYKVGDVNGGSFELQGDYANVNLDADLNTLSKEDVSDWLKAANALADSTAGKNPESTVSSDRNGAFKFTTENGLYLITGESKRIDDYPNAGDSSYLWPQPMLVLVLNGDANIGVKPTLESVSSLRIQKVWANDEEVAELVRPDEVKIEIYYEDELWNTVTLKEEKAETDDDTVFGDWKFEYEVEKDKADPSAWSFKEVLRGNDLKNYKFDIDKKYVDPREGNEAGKVLVGTITNTYDRKTLDIEKTVDTFIDTGSGASTFVFELTGFDADNNEAYHNYVGMNYDPSDPNSHRLNVKDIPANLSRLMVKEVYSSNYTPDSVEKEATLNYENGTYSVSFSNRFDNNTTFGTGIINKGKISNNQYVENGKIENQ